MTTKAAAKRKRSIAKGTQPKQATHPVVTVKPDPRVWEHALGLAGGNVKRLSVLPDGAVIVRNN